jgi:hypothetical protein
MKSIKMWITLTFDDNTLNINDLEKFRSAVEYDPKSYLKFFMDKVFKDEECSVSVNWES